MRFKSFEDNWTLCKIGDLSSKVGSGSTPRGGEKVYTEVGIPFIRSQNITNNGLVLKGVSFVPEHVHHKMKGSAVLSNDVLLNITGASIGRSCVVPENFNEGNVNQHVCIIRLKPAFEPRFLQAYISSFKGQKSILQSQVGSGREGLNFQSIRLMHLSIPSLPEQQKIASFLTAVDDKIQQLSKKKALLEQYKKGVMQQLFSQKLRFKDDQGNEFPDWEEKRLGDVVKFFKGSALSKSDIVVDGSNPCIHYGELFTIYNEVITHVKSRTNVLGFSSKKGDILMPSSDVTPLGLATASAILADNVILGGDINVLRPFTIDPIFLSYLINYEKKQVIQLVSGTTVKHIYSKDLVSINLVVPSSIIEQSKIANFLSAIDDKIKGLTQQIEYTRQFKKGLLQQMFV